MERFKITYKRGHGTGGQHKNKVESCVVVVDPVTGMTETCQETRSQAKNRSLAVERLTLRVETLKGDIETKARNTQRLKAMSAGVIRTYNFPRNEAKDHRTGKKANLKKVLNGAINLLR